MTDGSGISRILARGVLKVRPHAKRGGRGGGGGQSTSGPTYEKCVGGGGAVHFRSNIRKVCVWGGGGAVHFRSNIQKVGGGGNSLQVRYEKWGGQSASGPIPLFGTQLSLIINSYNFDRGGLLKHPEHPHPTPGYATGWDGN